MKLLTDHRVEPITITQICHQAGINRSGFYHYFESIADLDDRFLDLFFHSCMKGKLSLPTSAAEASQFYQELVLAMRSQLKFFLALYGNARLSRYRVRWKLIVDGWLQESFAQPGVLTNQALWDLNLEFATGVAGRYLELAIVAAPPLDLATLTRKMLIFQLGGFLKLLESDQEDEKSLQTLDGLLATRRQLLNGKRAGHKR